MEIRGKNRDSADRKAEKAFILSSYFFKIGL
jgi:hypothetical protein